MCGGCEDWEQTGVEMAKIQIFDMMMRFEKHTYM